MNRREFVMNLSTAAAATLAALATPLRLFAGGPARIAPAKIAKRSTNSDADLKRLLDSLPCRCLEKFVLTWNAAYPRVEEIEHRLADARRWVSPSGDTGWEKERVACLEKELADAEQFRIEHPDRYTVGLGRRIDVEVTRRHSVDNDAEWRILVFVDLPTDRRDDRRHPRSAFPCASRFNEHPAPRLDPPPARRPGRGSRRLPDRQADRGKLRQPRYGADNSDRGPGTVTDDGCETAS
jgi:hypothetical protein